MKASPLALVGGTVYGSAAEAPFRDGVVLLSDGKVLAAGARSVAVPHGFEILDCSGCTIVPGFWNSHVHFFERKWSAAAGIPAPELERQLHETFSRYGFTHVFDLSSLWENTHGLRERIESGEVAGPAIRSTGEGLLSPGALPSETVTRMMGIMPTPMPEVADTAQAVAAARALLENGADGIKLFVQPAASGAPAFSTEIIAAVAKEAHRAGKPVFAHPAAGDDVLTALRGGVDVIAHTTPHSGAWNDEIFEAVRERKVALTPTLALWKYFARHDRLSAQEQIVETACAQLRGWIAAGGAVLFGTDLGAVGPNPLPEYELMEEAGMSFDQILASLTSTPAQLFGGGERLGRIAPGYEADITVLRRDPAGARAFAGVRLTLRSGVVVYC
ncbi:MAG TPA: amidohydrolase family protein [Candidatus Rubrimentiphilum sp.]|nr:amidohydrolase family protein [Candidatus Rubrimentiphilum sp.]